MNSQNIKVAAVADIHFKVTDRGKWAQDFKNISEKADILLLCGDLTDNGEPAEAEAFSEELKSCSIPVIAVMGNHDYDRGLERQIKSILSNDNVHVLDGEYVVIKGIGFAGTKGFGGGFDRYMLSTLGEKMIKNFVNETVDEALRLDRALSLMESDHPNLQKIVLLHYSPIKGTVLGEPEEIFPFLGSSRLAEPLNRRQVLAAFHGHAHIGTMEGATSKGVKIYNVARPILIKEGYELPFYIYEVPVLVNQ